MAGRNSNVDSLVQGLFKQAFGDDPYWAQFELHPVPEGLLVVRWEGRNTSRPKAHVHERIPLWRVMRAAGSTRAMKDLLNTWIGPPKHPMDWSRDDD
jgi:hypothetical protein